MKRVALVFSFLIFGWFIVFAPYSNAQIPSGRDVVAPAAYASSDPAARAMNLQIAVVLKIRSGFHVNAREVSADYLIPTDLKGEALRFRRASRSTCTRTASRCLFPCRLRRMRPRASNISY